MLLDVDKVVGKVADLAAAAAAGAELNPRLCPLGTGRPESGAGTEELRRMLPEDASPPATTAEPAEPPAPPEPE